MTEVCAFDLRDCHAQERNMNKPNWNETKPWCFYCGRNLNPKTAHTLYLTKPVEDHYTAFVVEHKTPYPILLGPECIKHYYELRDQP